MSFYTWLTVLRSESCQSTGGSQHESAHMLGQRVHSWCCGSDPNQLIPQIIRPENLPETLFSFSIFQSAWEHPQNSPGQPLVNGTYQNVNALILVSIPKIRLATPLGPTSICLVIINEARESYLCIQSWEWKKGHSTEKNFTETAAKRLQLPIALLSFALCKIQPSLVHCMQTFGHRGLRCKSEQNSLTVIYDCIKITNKHSYF